MTVLSGEPSTEHIYRDSRRSGLPSTYMTPEGKALKEQYRRNAEAQWEGEPIQDDSQISARHLHRAHDKQRPRIEVDIRPISGPQC